MGRPRIDLASQIKEIVTQVSDLPAWADTPLKDYWRATGEIWNLLHYLERKLDQTLHYAKSRDQHMRHFHSMMLVNLVEAFERFLKEVAACCTDRLAPYVLDDRFSVFGRIHPSALAAHFGAESLGRSLCEADTWLDCDEINKRFRSLLSLPFDKGGKEAFDLFPKQGKAHVVEQYSTLRLIWQLRHTVVHNVGVVTKSDAVKLRLLARRRVDAQKLLRPTRAGVFYLKRFLDEIAQDSNERIGRRLAHVLTAFLVQDTTLFDAQEIADSISRDFGFQLAVNGVAGTIPPR